MVITRCVASNDRLRELGWKPEFDTIEKVVETAWKWHNLHPDGYAEKD